MGLVHVLDSFLEMYDPIEDTSVYLALINLLFAFGDNINKVFPHLYESPLFAKSLGALDRFLDDCDEVNAMMSETAIKTFLNVFEKILKNDPQSKLKFQEMNGVEILMKCMNIISEDNSIKISAMLNLAISSDMSDEYSTEIFGVSETALKNLFDNILLYATTTTTNTNDFTKYIDNGYKTMEIVQFFARSESNSAKLVHETNLLDLIEVIFKSEQDKGDMVKKGLGILWELSFEKSNKQTICDRTALMKLLDELTNAVREGNESESNLARNILWQLSQTHNLSQGR